MSDILSPNGFETAGAIEDNDVQEIYQPTSGGVRRNKQVTMAIQKIYHQKLGIFTPNNIMESDGTGNPRTTSIATSAVQSAITDTNTNTNAIAANINQGVKTTDDPIFAGATIDGHDVGAELSTLNNRVDQGVNIADSPTFTNATIGGHNIDSELDSLNNDVNQGVKTTDDPTFNNAFIGGHNIDSELDILNSVVDQDLTSTATPTFADVILTGLGAIKAFILTLNSRVNQELNTTSTPNFEDINLTGLTGTVEDNIEGNAGAITALENLQPTETTDDVTFKDITATGKIKPEKYFTNNTMTISALYAELSSWVPVDQDYRSCEGVIKNIAGSDFGFIQGLSRASATSIKITYISKSSNIVSSTSLAAANVFSLENIEIWSNSRILNG